MLSWRRQLALESHCSHCLMYVSVPTFESVGERGCEQLSRIRPVAMSLTTTNPVTRASILISPVKMGKQRVPVTRELAGSPGVGFWFFNLNSSSFKPVVWAFRPPAVSFICTLNWNHLLTCLSSLLCLFKHGSLVSFSASPALNPVPGTPAMCSKWVCWPEQNWS